MSQARRVPHLAEARTWGGFATMCVGMFMAVLDVQVVATSLPTIQHSLGVAPDAISWVQTAYLTAEVVSIPLTGLLTRIMSLRWLVVAALVVFTAASVGCAASATLPELVVWRLIQGFAGGTLIPAVFTAVFLLFPLRDQPLATTLAGVLAVLAPTVGPIVGGFITDALSWHWLFLINVAPGFVAAILAARLLPRAKADAAAARQLDVPGLALMALSLATLMVALREAPTRGWLSPLVGAAFLIAGLGSLAFVRRTLKAPRPLVALRLLRDRNFGVGCLLSFVFGAGLFGSVYMMPVFLAYVRGHGPFEIGRIMLVTGVAQLFAAPFAAALEARVDARLLTAAGFLLFAAGLGLSTVQTIATDYDAMVWPQILRGIGIMFCLVPTTRLALGLFPAAEVPDASGLFNLLRNLGGAIGLALIDTILYGRAPVIGEALEASLRAGDPAAARQIGIPATLVAHQASGALDPHTIELLRSLIAKAALTQAMNEVWGMLAILTCAASLAVLWANRART